MRVFEAVLLASVLSAQQAPAPTAILSGTVIDAISGLPLNKVHILVESIASRGRAAATTTNAKGEFKLSGIVPGQYRLKGQRNGYLDTYYGTRRATGPGIPITVEEGDEITGLEFKLLPFAVIAGTVREPDGEPVTDAEVAVYRLTFDNGRRRVSLQEHARSDDRGEYRIVNLPPGRYYVRAEPRKYAADAIDTNAAGTRREILLPGMYLGGTDQTNARAIDLNVGARLSGIDITLVRTTGVRVTGYAAAAAGTTLGGISLTYGRTRMDPLALRLETRADAKGRFVFPNIPAGAYTLTAVANPPAKPTNRIQDLLFNQREYQTHVSVQVGHTGIDDLRVIVEAGVEVSGRIVLDSASGDTLIGGVVFFDSGSERAVARVGSDGIFSVALTRGHYKIYPYFSDVVTQSILSNGRNILEEGLTIGEAGVVALDVVVSRDGGQVGGVVLNKENKEVAGVTAVLVPENRLRFRLDLFRKCETDQHGRYLIKSIPPGEYKLFAWDDVEDGLWHDPDFLKQYEALGTKVTVDAKGSYTEKIRLIAAQP